MKVNTYAGAGMWSWLLQRITGLLLVIYLMIHLWGLHFRSEIKTPLDPVFLYILSRDFFLILLILIVYHGFNGLRSVAVDLGGGIRFQRLIFWILMALGIVILYIISLESRRF